MAITIRKALNMKNLMVADISEIRGKITSNNAITRKYRVDANDKETLIFASESANIDIKALFKIYEAKLAKLIELKTKIHMVNSGAKKVEDWETSQYFHIVSVEELKGKIAFVQCLCNRGDGVNESVNRLTETTYERVVTKTNFQYSNTEVDEIVARLKGELETHLDAIEEFNSSRKVDFEV